jgi:hypothetical protein
MRVVRSFAASSSANSILLGFLDVISCGFAAALVLGLIFSLVQPHESGAGAHDTPYRYFEFSVKDEGSSQGRPYLSPQIFYKADKKSAPIRMEVQLFQGQRGKSNVGDQSVELEFVGAAAIENQLLTLVPSAPNTAPNQPAGFGIIVTGLGKEASMSIALIYSSRSDLDYYVTRKQSAPPITVTRLEFGGPEEKDHKPKTKTLTLGEISDF